ncbi:phospholipase D family protein [Aestuariivirga litoralis]|uniref:phospholipase D family protein n=1 Tax=Aestuariivirga litoralis TaxID=2650924 RepID=UPI001AEDA057|nr:phospholipase D family protein [Aestuariivirga litoralis]
MIFFILVVALICALAIVATRALFPLPKSHGSRATHNHEGPSELGRRYGPRARQTPKRSGLYPISNGQEALAIRLELAKMANHSINTQYYIWNDDLSGQLLLSALVDAADRGVKVRIIMDDNTTGGTDAVWAAAAQHANISVKLFNPFRIRRFRTINYFVDFMRLNRRMHNKSFIVDGVACIVGGRNVGDNYFAASTGPHFTDVDVLAFGEVVPHVAKAFDSYWTCASVYDVRAIIKRGDLDALRQRLQESSQSPQAMALNRDMAKFSSSRQISRGKLALEWAPARLLVDHPKKGQGKAKTTDLVADQLRPVLARGQRELKVASAYFVPGKGGTRFLQSLAKRGLAVQILTNSLSSNNLITVHSGYARYRKKLLRAGVELYELKANRKTETEKAKEDAKTSRVKKFFGASSSTLHAKVFILDRQKLFISSFNFDPRSIFLNCEMGILMESAVLARNQLRQVEQQLRRNSYRLELLDGHRLIWLDLQRRKIGVLGREPDTGLSRRIMVWLISKLPLEWML